MKNLIILLVLFLSLVSKAQDSVTLCIPNNTALSNQFNYGFGPYSPSQQLIYDGSSSNFVRLDMTMTGGYLLLTNNACIWADNLPNSTLARQEYLLSIVAVKTNQFTLTTHWNSNPIHICTNFFNPITNTAARALTNGWTATVYEIQCIGPSSIIYPVSVANSGQ